MDEISGGLYKLSPEQLRATLSKQLGATVAPTKDGVCVVLVKAPEQGWVKVGQVEHVAGDFGN